MKDCSYLIKRQLENAKNSQKITEDTIKFTKRLTEVVEAKILEPEMEAELFEDAKEMVQMTKAALDKALANERDAEEINARIKNTREEFIETAKQMPGGLELFAADPFLKAILGI